MLVVSSCTDGISCRLMWPGCEAPNNRRKQQKTSAIVDRKLIETTSEKLLISLSMLDGHCLEEKELKKERLSDID